MSTRLSTDDATLISQFRQLRTFTDIARLLEVTPAQLRHYTRRADNYKSFDLSRKGGGKRTISTPVTPLKIIQQKLNQVLQPVYGGRSPCHGFTRKRSIITNAERHLNRSFVLNFDLANFFPSIHFGRVKGLFERKPYNLPESVAVTLAQICCHNGALPVGAPTSPVVANMLCAQMDSQLKKLAIECGCIYTRYADDITFSVAHGRFPPPITYRDTNGKCVIGEGVAQIVAANKFVINASKTRLLPRGYRQEVTGLVVGRRINTKRKYVLRVRGMLHAAEKWGVDRASQFFHAKYDRKRRLKKPDFLRVLRGKIEFIGAVRGRDDGIYLGFLLRYLKLDPGASARPITITDRADPATVEKAVWLLEQADGDIQGTAFAAENFDLITAAHAATATTEASCPALNIPPSGAGVVCKEEHVDVARMASRRKPPVQLKLGTSANLRIGDAIKVLGFPLHRKGGSVHVQTGKITQFSPWFGVPHYVVDCPIVRGNSGGPVLNVKNEVIGIAVKGQGTPRQYRDHDELSRFVPIDFAVKYLEHQPTQEQSKSAEPPAEPAVPV